ncbi:hypothetical protein BJ878DRAFT_128268 [Calycina marina]|uniref:WD repeat-containing protein WRAP73 n=1 Tax=Calycina marina TaxID=1763456 RepID=A0A9P7Z178_9HELO|nr:hypothetical protein BJ878DRAFT_128268 [Calycina marina]
MRFSRTLKSSVQSLPSPDGTHIATIFPAKLSIRDTGSLEITRVINLPAELAASISWFFWSASSGRILVASSAEIRIYSPTSSQVVATISNPNSGTTRLVHVAFGATENEVCVFSEFGLKLSVFNLTTSKSVDINSPKFFSPGVAARGLSYRPQTLNLALLTRNGGKDIVSIHARDTLEVTRSWNPDTIDAQGLSWSADGRWLAVWESASQGHRFLIYAADGYIYKTWNGPIPTTGDTDFSLGPGIKLFEWNRSGSHVAVGDYSSRVIVLSAPLFTESMNLLHTANVKPAEGLQVWQELATAQHGGVRRDFIQARQIISPPASTTTSTSDSNTKSGTNTITFDKSGTLLATKVEIIPTTIWIWDISTKILRTVLILHAPIAKLTWHPTIDELLLIRCEGPDNRALVHLWCPSWESPQIIDFAAQLPGGKILGKTVGRWLNTRSATAVIFFSDSQDCILASLSGPDDSTVPWQDAEVRGLDIYRRREESPLNLVAADKKASFDRVSEIVDDDNADRRSGGSEDYVEDTFLRK